MAFDFTGFPSFTPPTNRAVRSTPLPAVPQNPQAGSLVIIDQFRDTYQGAAHGNVAAHAAQQHGFRGPVYAENIGPDRQVPSRAAATLGTLSRGPSSPAATRQAITNYSSQTQQELLNDVTGDLNKVRRTGLHDSAVNVSYGVHPQMVAEELYRRVRTAPTSPPPPASPGGFGGFGGFGAAQTEHMRGEYQFAQNVTNAYGIDRTKLNSRDAAVSGPERLRLQQALLNAAQAGGQSAEVRTAQNAYGQAVRNIEANNNSVVVSVGNQAEILDNLARDAGGRRVNARADSAHNVLVNSDVTTVGSTRFNGNGRERIAEYSTRDPQVDIYASGSVGTGRNQNVATQFGTSYAAPRVAGMMASLHGTRPGTPSNAVQNLMRNRLTHEVQGQPTLDFRMAEEYMRTGTF